MKISSKQLQSLIQEEISKASRRPLNEGSFGARAGEPIYDIESSDLLDFARAYQSLGDAVSEQLDSLMDDPNADCNPNAVDLIEEHMGGFNEEIDEAILAWKEAHNNEPEAPDEDEEDDGTWAAAARINGLRR